MRKKESWEPLKNNNYQNKKGDEAMILINQMLKNKT